MLTASIWARSESDWLVGVGQGLVVAAGLDINHGAGVMITDDGQVPVRMAVTDRIDPDPVEGVEPGHQATRPHRG